MRLRHLRRQATFLRFRSAGPEYSGQAEAQATSQAEDTRPFQFDHHSNQTTSNDRKVARVAPWPKRHATVDDNLFDSVRGFVCPSRSLRAWPVEAIHHPPT